MITETRTREIVEKLYRDIADGNVGAVLDALSPDIEFELQANQWNAVIPNLGVHRGKDAVAEAFRLRGLHTDVQVFDLRDVLVERNRAFAVIFTRLRHTRTDVVFEHEMSQRLTLDDDGRISAWKVYFDSAGEVAAFSADLDEQLFAVVRQGGHAQVASLLSYGANPNYRDPGSGLTTLMLAAGLGASAVVKQLLDAGGDVYTTDSRGGGTALHKAVQGGDLDTVRALVQAGAFVDAPAATTGHTPLMDALWYKWPDIAGYLLERNASVNLSTHYGFSMKEHFEYELNVNSLGKEKLLAADELLKRRARSDEDSERSQPLMAAVTKGDAARVRELLAGGADVDARFPVVNGFNDAHTPLLVAARDGHTDCVRALLDAGANVNATEPTFGASPLHKAVYNGHADITALLVAAPGTDLDYQGATNGYTPLHDALWHGYRECAQILIDAGARLDVAGHDGKTPLDIAVDVFGPDHEFAGAIRAMAAA